MKKSSLLVLCFLGVSLLSAQESESDDFDQLFESAQDVVVETKKEETDASFKSKFYLPITFSGKLNAKSGGGYQYSKVEEEKADHDGFCYFDFENYLYINARTDRTFSFNASILTDLKDLTSVSSYIDLYEMYFDYVLADRLYVTGGKKYISWSYIRLFKDDEKVKDSEVISFYRRTNLLFDSRKCVDFMLRFPFPSGTLSGVMLYDGTSSEPGFDSISFAGSAEMTFLNTSLNLFGRKTPEKNGYVTNGNLTTFVEGIELKRSVFGVDIYGQFMASARNFKKAFKYYRDWDNDYFKNLIATGGFYYLWDKMDPNFGVNVEYQYFCNNDYDVSGVKSDRHNHTLGFDVGVKKLGPKKNIKVGVEGRMSLSDWQGYVKPGISVSNIFPHLDWESGLKYEFNKPAGFSKTMDKITAGTYLKLHVNY